MKNEIKDQIKSIIERLIFVYDEYGDKLYPVGADAAAEVIANQINTGQLQGRAAGLLIANIQRLSTERDRFAGLTHTLACWVMDGLPEHREAAQDAIREYMLYLEGVE